MTDSRALLVLGADSEIAAEFLKGWKGDVLAHVFAKPEILDDLPTEANITRVKGDLSTEEGIRAFLAACDETGLEIGRILFLPSLPAKATRFSKFDSEKFQRELSVGYLSAALTFQKYLPKMAKSGGGQVAAVLTSYCIGVPPKFLASYVSVKYALMGLLKALAAEYGDKAITVNAIAPSMVETSFLSTLPGFEVEKNAQASPLGRNATPADLAPVLQLLLSGDAPYLSGAVIPVTSGSQF
ncbi:MAG: SDR family oxidoreductase [Oscillospiraceae bacterium]|nr:SDR family oxidoreductase [Oscillospiraceae bacterium]